MKNKAHQKLINTHILNSCFSKQPYDTEEEAWEVAGGIAAHRGDSRVMQPYHCKFCKKYHLTKLTPRQKERKMKSKVYVGNFSLRKTGKRYKGKKKFDK